MAAYGFAIRQFGIVRLNSIARGFLSPPAFLTVVWAAILVCIVVGPIDYPSLPSVATSALIVTGMVLFSGAHFAGVSSCAKLLRRRPGLQKSSVEVLNVAVGAASIVGLIGISLIALDRTVLSGVSNGGYAALLRCAPALVDYIEIKRTPLLYLGYLGFSFGFASLALFLLKGEEIRGWAGYFAQLSIISPVGYALLYSGRMPILFMIALIISVVMVRLAQKLPPFPRGHYLFVKMIVLVILFVNYSNAMWSSRQNFCVAMAPVVRTLQAQINERFAKADQARLAQKAEINRKLAALQNDPKASSPDDAKAIRDLKSSLAALEQELATPRRPRSGDGVNAAAVSMAVEAGKTHTTPETIGVGSGEIGPFLDIMRDSWHVTPRHYVQSALDSGFLSPSVARALLSNYFYLTHGVGILDLIWHSRAQLSPLWGVYEIGVLSPILRVFFPDNQILTTMSSQLRSADLYGFFPTVWGAAVLDFGVLGAVIYVLVWGGVGGWSWYGTRVTKLATPPLLLSFTFTSILLSPAQGPLGAANSALVLFSMFLLGVAVDLWTLRSRSRAEPAER